MHNAPGYITHCVMNSSWN